MGVSNGQLGNATVLNAAFLAKNADTTTTFKVKARRFDTTQTDLTLVNNSSGVVTGALLDKTIYRSARFVWQAHRKTNSSELAQMGSCMLIYDGTNWNIYDGAASGVDAGVTFTINTSTGQVSYATTNQTGTNVEQKLSWYHADVMTL